jgi:hypothetical protein
MAKIKTGIPGGAMGPLAKIIDALKAIEMTPTCFVNNYQNVMSYQTFALVLKGVRPLEHDEAKSLLATLKELREFADSFPYGLKPDWAADALDVRAALRTRRAQERELTEALALSQRVRRAEEVVRQ